MTVKDGRTRVQVTFGDEVLRRLDAFCDRTGMTRSSYITYIVGTSLEQYENLSKAAIQGVQSASLKAMNEKDK